jgi:hypothetical protein
MHGVIKLVSHFFVVFLVKYVIVFLVCNTLASWS